MTEHLVLDCSVAAKWYLQEEEDADLAEQFMMKHLRGDLELHGPELLKFDLANTLTKAQRGQRTRRLPTDSREAFKHFPSLGIRFHSFSDSTLENIIVFSNQFHRSFYDSCYLWLAQELDGVWLTAEKKFQGPFPLGFPKPRIRMLEDFRTDL